MAISRVLFPVVCAAGIGICLLPLTRHLSPELVQAAPHSIFARTAAYFSAPPSKVSISSIGLTSAIQAVGVNSRGEMDVPNGNGNSVGWYEYGTVPGNVGSAVLDAHVFAAFSKLSDIKAGSDIYVTEGARTLHFVVQSVQE